MMKLILATLILLPLAACTSVKDAYGSMTACHYPQQHETATN